jgi:hypothetical protein
VWVEVVSWLAVLAVVLTLGFLVRGWWRRHHRSNVGAGEASVRRWVAQVAARWTWDAQNLGLVLVDDTTRHQRSILTGHALPPVVRVPCAHF